MRLVDHLRMRVRRGFRLRTLGPNEARLLFDSAAAFAGTIAAILFNSLFTPRFTESVLVVVLLPTLFMIDNFVVGLYSRLRQAPTRTKTAAIFGSAALTSGISFGIGVHLETLVLCMLISVPLMVVARLFLNLPNSRNRRVGLIATNMRGPVLVIGGAGYIGTHTVEQLLTRGYPVRVIDNLMFGTRSLTDFMGNRDFEFVEGDATDLRRLAGAMRNVSAVIHLAGVVGDPASALDPGFTRHTNVATTRMAKDIAQSLGVRRFVFASSCSVYGAAAGEVDELSKLNPVSLYAETKIDSEQELLGSSQDDFLVTILRFATVFGHSRRPRFDLVANLFTAQAMTEGLITVIGPDRWRPFIHVRDLARAIVAVLDADPLKVYGQIFNVGDATLNMSILQLAEGVQRVTSRYRDARISISTDDSDPRNYVVSFAKIQSILGFRAETSIEDGIVEMARHFQMNEYDDYRSQIYSNVATLKSVLASDRDPGELMHLYAPVRLG